MEGQQSLIIGPLTLLCPNHWKVLRRIVTQSIKPDVCSTKASLSIKSVKSAWLALPTPRCSPVTFLPLFFWLQLATNILLFELKKALSLFYSMFFQPSMANIFNIKYEICMNYWVFRAFHKTDNLARCMCIKAEPERT